MNPNPRDLPPLRIPLKKCPHCAGWLYVESWHEIYEVLCINCSRTVAVWKPGMQGWRLGSTFAAEHWEPRAA